MMIFYSGQAFGHEGGWVWGGLRPGRGETTGSRAGRGTTGQGRPCGSLLQEGTDPHPAPGWDGCGVWRGRDPPNVLLRSGPSTPHLEARVEGLEEAAKSTTLKAGVTTIRGRSLASVLWTLPPTPNLSQKAGKVGWGPADVGAVLGAPVHPCFPPSLSSGVMIDDFPGSPRGTASGGQGTRRHAGSLVGAALTPGTETPGNGYSEGCLSKGPDKGRASGLGPVEGAGQTATITVVCPASWVSVSLCSPPESEHWLCPHFVIGQG